MYEIYRAFFKCLNAPMLNTTGKDDPIAEAIRSVIAVFAGLERHLISERTSEGRAHARAEGRKLGGPKPKLTRIHKEQALLMMEQGMKNRQIAKALSDEHFKISHTPLAAADCCPPQHPHLLK